MEKRNKAQCVQMPGSDVRKELLTNQMAISEYNLDITSNQGGKEVRDSQSKDQNITNSPALTRQAMALWAILKNEGKINTLEARRRGINHCAGRIRDLRDKKIPVETHWTEAISQTGKVTKVALYVLTKNPQISLFDAPQNPKEVSK